MKASARWNALAADLHRAGFLVEVGQVPIPGGSSYRVRVETPAGEVALRDAFRRDEWIGWRGWRETDDPDLAASLEPTKRRADVIRFVTTCAAVTR